MLQKTITFILLFCLPTIMLAHGSHGSGMMAGFTHPIFGIDHNLAILGSGILGYLVDNKKGYLYPLAFILFMIIGGMLGIGSEATMVIEKIIAFSVFAIGCMIAFRMNVKFILLIAILAGLGFFHGCAHGAEMPETNTALKYISGYSLGALLLAAIGSFIGKTMHDNDGYHKYIPILGGIIIGCGLMMLLA